MADLAQLRAEAQDLEAEVPNEELRDLIVRFRHLIDRLAAQEAIERAGIPPHLRPGRPEMTNHKVLFWVEPRKDEDG